MHKVPHSIVEFSVLIRTYTAGLKLHIDFYYDWLQDEHAMTVDIMSYMVPVVINHGQSICKSSDLLKRQ